MIAEEGRISAGNTLCQDLEGIPEPGQVRLPTSP
jgi:hypothetical protein